MSLPTQMNARLLVLVVIFSLLAAPVVLVGGSEGGDERPAGADARPEGTDAQGAPVSQTFPHPADARSQPAEARAKARSSWPMFGGDEHRNSAAPSYPKGVERPSLKWDRGESLDSWGTTIGDFTGNVQVMDGSVLPQCDAIVYGEDGYVYVIEGISGEPMWVLNASALDGTEDIDPVHTTPTLLDYDSDGKMDILFCTGEGDVYMFEPEIRLQAGVYNWTFAPGGEATAQVWSYDLENILQSTSPLLADVDSDGKVEAVLTSQNTAGGTLAWALELAPDDQLGPGGRLVAGWGEAKALEGSRVSSAAMYYLDPVTPRLAITTFDGTDQLLRLYLLNSGTGTTLQVVELGALPYTPLAPFGIIPTPATGELDPGTVGEEIVVLVPIESGNDGAVYVIGSDYSQVWDPVPNIQGIFDAASPVIGDIDGDGDNDVVVSSWQLTLNNIITHLYAFEGDDGAEIWHTEKDTTSLALDELSVSTPVLADLNKDGKLDVIGATNPQVYAIDGPTGNYIWNTTISEGDGRLMYSSPAVGDIDRDDFVDITLESFVISQELIDLTLDDTSVKFLPEPTEGEEGKVSVTVVNQGSSPADGIRIRLYEEGVPVSNATVQPMSGYGDTREVFLNWTPAEKGLRELWLVVDPDDAIQELEEGNNNITVSRSVGRAFADLTVTDIHFYRADGTEADSEEDAPVTIHLVEGERSNITATVANIGSVGAEDIVVTFTSDGKAIGTAPEISSIGRDGSVNVSIAWRAPEGAATMGVTVDPDFQIDEYNETNNLLEEDLYVKSDDPEGAPFVVSGTVTYEELQQTDVEMTFENLRTGERETNTSVTGLFTFNALDLPSGYLEGDTIEVHASKADLMAVDNVSAYSEDGGATLVLELGEIPTYALDLSAPEEEREVEAGETHEFDITVRNEGNSDNTIELRAGELEDPDGTADLSGWAVALSDDTVTLGAGSQAVVTLALNVSSDAPAGTRAQVTVTARSRADAAQTDSVTLKAAVASTHIIELTLDDTLARVDPQVELEASTGVNVLNRGNVEEKVGFTVTGLPSGWSHSIKDQTELIIPPGENRSLDWIITLPEDAEPGDHPITLGAETGAGSNGTGAADTAVFTVTVVRPDLVLAEISLDPLEPVQGDTAEVELYIINEGPVDAPAFTVEFSVENREKINDTNGIVLSLEDSEITTLKAGGSTTVKFSWALSSTGVYILTGTLDPGDDVIEAYEDNNEVELTYSLLPDLMFEGEPESSIRFPETGDKVEISAVVLNDGPVDVVRTFQVDFYEGDREDGELIETVTVLGGLAAGDTYDVEVVWRPGDAGERTIWIGIDTGSVVDELNDEAGGTDNNWKSLEITVDDGGGGGDGDGGTDTGAGGDGGNNALIGLVVALMIGIVLFMIIVPWGRSKGKDENEDEDEEGEKDEEDDDGEEEEEDGDDKPGKKKGKGGKRAGKKGNKKAGKKGKKKGKTTTLPKLGAKKKAGTSSRVTKDDLLEGLGKRPIPATMELIDEDEEDEEDEGGGDGGSVVVEEEVEEVEEEEVEEEDDDEDDLVAVEVVAPAPKKKRKRPPAKRAGVKKRRKAAPPRASPAKPGEDDGEDDPDAEAAIAAARNIRIM